MNDLDFSGYGLGWKCCKLVAVIGIVPFLATPENSLGQAFKLRTQDAGLGAVLRTDGAAVADYDRDGDLDVYFVVIPPYLQNKPETWNRLFSNNGDGTFLDVTTIAGVAAEAPRLGPGMGFKTGASWGDYDNDGWPDLFLTKYGPNQLFHNNGDGTFTDVTNQAGVAGGGTQQSQSALWFDYDLDGDLDLYVSVWYEKTLPPDTRNWMYENLGSGQFMDVSEASGLADPGKTYMSVAIDANNDGYLDLYLANDFAPSGSRPNKFYLNNGDKTFQ
jgi:hypothetical protein